MAELQKCVQDIFDESKHDIGCYNIPEYQRGYKWDAENVKVLLDDFRDFHNMLIKSKDKKQYYCLQNITLCKTENGYNVVDGQQRLTTLVLLLSYLGKSNLVRGKMKYSIRENTHQFIQEQIVKRLIWNNPICPENADTKDQYYLSDVAKAIQDWFDKEKNQLDNFDNTILNHVKLIVNKLDGNEEKIFSSLNGGKVSLDGADLIRAILMTRAAKEKFRESGINEKINEFRVRMGIEIDSINLWWGDRNIYTYFEQFLPDKVIKQAKSGFDYTAFPINLLYMLYFESKKGKKEKEEIFSFRFFEYGQDSNDNADDDHWEMYDEIMTLHHTMIDWYNDRVIYHYLGYLFFQFKTKINFKDIHHKWLESESKSQFRNLLKRMIIEFILSEYKDDSSSEQTTIPQLTDLKNDILETSNNWYGKDNLFNILILQDILHCIHSQNMDVLNVKYFRPNKEDTEHIRSRTPKWNNETRNKKEWEDFISQFEGISEDDKQKLKSYLPIENTDLNGEQFDKISNEMNQFGLNSIGNMALLDSGVNRGYGNADYLSKRSTILSRYYSGTYIRPHTLRVFMKGNSNLENNQNKWLLKDISDNAQTIYNTIETWINTK